jgi:hypothetical protein
MDPNAHTRYPGAQPFADDDLSRRLFFGRGVQSTELTNQILANRLVVLYGRSGLGKTSLLHAGVAPRLREEGHLPLSVRVNDTERGPIASVFAGIEAEARRQGIEYVAGSIESMWAFFRTVEFWRDDLLLVPVLILDQFEELFTLQSEERRSAFLVEIGHLLRGVAPEGYVDPNGSSRPPSLRVVFSLREDYLGLLDDGADLIPEILDERFRITPLGVPAATEALVEPARVEDSAFATPAFAYDPLAVQAIVEFLCHRRVAGVRRDSRTIDPFQLQLICQRVERIVRDRAPNRAGEPVTLKELGGSRALEATLRRFYLDILRAVPRRDRAAVQRLCQEILISSEGRRLSLEENTIVDTVGLSPERLRDLVARRLLRIEQRADNSYYELSHDALIEPVLGARRSSAIWMARARVVGGGFGVAVTVLFALLLALSWMTSHPPAAVATLVALILVIMAGAGVGFASVLGVGLQSLRRYGGHAGGEFRSARPSTLSGRAFRLAALFFSFGVLFVDGLVAATCLGAMAAAWSGAWNPTDSPGWQRFLHARRLDTVPIDWAIYTVGSIVAVVFWTHTVRNRARALVHGPSDAGPAPLRVEGPLWRRITIGGAYLVSAIAAGADALFAAGFLGLLARCRSPWNGRLPLRVHADHFMAIAYTCEGSLNDSNFFAGLLYAVPHLAILLWMASRWTRRGLLHLWGRGGPSPLVWPWRDSMAPLAVAGRWAGVTACFFGAFFLPLAAIVYLGSWAAPAPPLKTSTPPEPQVVPVSGSSPAMQVRILGASGRPVAGALVRLVSVAPPFRVFDQATTDAEGAAQLVPAAFPTVILAEDSAEGVATSDVQDADAGDGDRTLTLSPRGVVQGKVVDARGLSVAGVRVAVADVPWANAVSDRTGAFRLPVFPDGARAIVAVSEGCRAERMSLEPAPSGQGTRLARSLLRIVLHPGKTLDGTVSDDRGRPAVARVVACPGDPAEFTTESTPAGAFQVPPSTVGCRVVAASPECGPSEDATVDADSPLILRLTSGGGVTGTAVDSQGKPVTAFDLGVELFTPFRGPTMEHGGRTNKQRRFGDSNGAFTWDRLAPGRYVFTGIAERFAPSSTTVEVRAGLMTGGVRLVFAQGAVVIGTVTDTTHTPVADANVEFEDLSNVLEAGRSVTTGRDGSYRLEGAPDGLFSMDVRKKGFGTVRVSGLSTHGSEMTLRQDVTLSREAEGKTSGSFVGVGVTLVSASDGPVVDSVTPGGPAIEAGVRAGDRLLSVDDAPANELPLTALFERLRGAEGTQVVIALDRPATGELLHRTLTRARLSF